MNEFPDFGYLGIAKLRSNSFVHPGVITFPINPLERTMDWEFLHQSVANIFDSYHAPDQDILIETIQNAVDAIEERALVAAKSGEKYTPQIWININTVKNRLEIIDNGIGVPETVLQQLGSPHNTSKKSGKRRGHKGVGLTFVAWASDKFQFATKRADWSKTQAGSLVKAFSWVKTGGGPCPVINSDEKYASMLPKEQSGTAFAFEFPPENRVLATFKRLTPAGQEIFLRTKTAIGNVNLPELDMDANDWVSQTRVMLRMDNGLLLELSGLGFRYPHTLVDRKKSASLTALAKLSQSERNKVLRKKQFIYTTWTSDQVVDWLKNSGDYADLADFAKAQQVAVYCAFADQKKTIDTLNEALYAPGFGGRRRNVIASGIQIATASMPVGQLLDPELKFGPGNKNRIMAVCDFKQVRPDYGRKTFEDDVVRIANALVDHIVGKELVPERDFLIKHEKAHGETAAEQEMNLDAFKEAAIGKPDLKLQDLGVVKEPANEQEVCALFHALLGAKHLRGYRMYSSPGSRAKYDAFFELLLTKSENQEMLKELRVGQGKFPAKEGKIVYKSKILEFKFRASGLVEDFEEEIKDPSDIFAVVCWEVGLTEQIKTVGDVYRLADHEEDPDLPGQTHLLEYEGRKFKVVCLGDVITNIAANI